MRTIKNKSSKKSLTVRDSGTDATVAENPTIEGSEGTSEGNEPDGEGATPEEEKDWSAHVSLTKTETHSHPFKVPVPGQKEPTTIFVTAEYAREIMATTEGKEARKEVRTQNGAARKSKKEQAAIDRANFQKDLQGFAKTLEEVGIKIDTAPMSQHIHVKKDAMTIRGVTFKSPIGMGGARYYINHSSKKNAKWANEEEKNKLLQFGQTVALAAAVAAQKAGLEAMIKLAPKFGIDLAGLTADDSDDDGGAEG